MMIFIKNRQAEMPYGEELNIGFEGDNEVKTVAFCFLSTEFSEYSFRLDLEKANGEKGIAYLGKSVQENRILLFWKPAASQLCAGELRAQIRAFRAEGEEVWHSEQMVFHVGESIEAAQEYPEVLPSEFIELEKRIAEMDERISGNASVSQTMHDAVKDLHKETEMYHSETVYESRLARDYASDARKWADESKSHATEAEGYAKEAKEVLASLEKGADGFSPIVEIVPWENSNSYRMIKKEQRMSTIRWCDEADGDTERNLSFTAKVECYLPYASHAWYIQVRKSNGSDVTLMQLGSDGAGNTIVYDNSERVRQLTSGWHDYSFIWNSKTGDYQVVADGMIVSEGNNPKLKMEDAHGIQITAAWGEKGVKDDKISFDRFSLYGDGVLRYSDDFNEAPIGSNRPNGNWYQNDSGTQNIREVYRNEDQELYIKITDAEGVKKSGNIMGKNATLTTGSVKSENISLGAVGMEQLSPEVRAILQKAASLTAEEAGENGVG